MSIIKCEVINLNESDFYVIFLLFYEIKLNNFFFPKKKNMRSRKAFLIILFLSILIFVTYYFVLNETASKDLKRIDFLKQLDTLEVNIKDESQLNDVLLRNLLDILRAKNSINSIPSNLNEIQNFDSVIKEITLEPTKIVDKDKLSKLNSLEEKDYHSFNGPIIPVLVFACNRVSITNCLDNLIQYRPNSHQFPIIVSQVIFFLIFLSSIN